MPSQNHQYFNNNFESRNYYTDTAAINALYKVGGEIGGTVVAGVGGSGSVGGGGIVSGGGGGGVGRASTLQRHKDESTTLKSNSNFGSLRGNFFKSNQSLCSCNAETEIDVNPSRPLYQYSLDRKNIVHTYTCEQNAQILLRLEREHQQRNYSKNLKNSRDSINHLHKQGDFKSISASSPRNYHENNDINLVTETYDIDLLPPPPTPLSRKPSFNHHQSSQIKPKAKLIATTVLNSCAKNSTACIPAFEHSKTVVVSENNNNNNININNNNHKNDNKIVENNKHRYKTNSKLEETENISNNNDLNFQNNKIEKDKESLFFYHHEPNQYIPNYDTMHHYHHNIPGKYNTIGPSIKYYRNKQKNTVINNNFINDVDIIDKNNKLHSSTCNFKPLSPLHKSYSNLISGRYFSNSLTHFNNPTFNHQHYLPNNNYNYNNQQDHHYHHHHHHHNHQQHPYRNGNINNTSNTSQYIQFQNIDEGETIFGSNTGLYGSSNKLGKHTPLTHQAHHHHHNSDYNHGSNNNIPWRHRQCPSIGSNSSGTSITRWDPSRHWLAVTSILLIAGAAGVAVPLALRVAAGAPFEERLQVANQLLASVPLIDGHNDLPWNIRKFLHNQLNEFDFDINLKSVLPWSKSNWSHTDLHRLKKGQVSAQFWAAYVPCEAQHKDAVQLTLEQIDVIIRLTEKYSPQLKTCTSAIDIIEAHKDHKLCSLTGVEGGHSLGGSLSVLRTFYTLGVRYMTLTSTCHTPWADSSYADAPKFDIKHGGLTEFGKTIIREMNRLGMIVDLSHVSIGTMKDALATSEAPVIFSHSSAYELCNSSRNVQDSVLELLVKNRGLVMINFYSKFLTCSEDATVKNAVAHINHIKLIAGVDHVGLGAGFDGINFTPKGLEDVSTYPILFAELLGDGWTMDELTKLAGKNFLRVLEEVESIRDKKRDEGIRPFEDILSLRLDDPFNCTSS